ncbi:hypothetical protein DICVIV_01604 [Dictyocaulus viviparus]|uniref:Uncharacterized protein n=1 Tax=Dictyocaulus viviparus TaxID=29172 RepID=A0A0D8Y812_DICVI|nr:hypothetical protein DICVIV_01604 [Dictyocaulus viviparus]
MLIAVILVFIAVVDGIFFGGGDSGGGGCCCGCGVPQPPSCGCQRPQCPVPPPCPACPQSCPPAPVAYCPQVQPVFMPRSNSGCNSGNGGCSTGYTGGGYTHSSNGVGVGGGAGYAAVHSPSSDVYSTGNGFTSGGGNGASYNYGAQDTYNGYNSQQAVAPSYFSQNDNTNTANNTNCEQPTVKYVMLKVKDVGQNPNEGMVEAEEVNQPSSVDATASPLDAEDFTDNTNRNEETEDVTKDDSQTRAQGAPTLSDAKCNSKPLKDLIIQSIVMDDALASKRNIHETSLKRFPDSTVDVICSGTGRMMAYVFLISP